MITKFGTKDWANALLRDGIAVLKELDREPGSRIIEVLCTIELLKERGYWWQAWILRRWLHRLWEYIRPINISKTPFYGL